MGGGPPGLRRPPPRRAGVPYVLRPAGMFSDYCLATRQWKKRLYWWACERGTVRGAAAFHCTGEDEVRDVLTVRPDAATWLVPQGIGEEALTAGRDETALRSRCGPAAGRRPIVLFLGRLHPVKGVVDLLLPAVARMMADAFVAVAGGSDALYPDHPAAIAAAVRRHGLSDRGALLGEVPAAERWGLFDGAAVFVLPSHSENFGMVVAEAMARGRPVVVTDGVQAKTHVLAAGAGAVVPFEPAALAAALDRYVADPEGAGRAGRAGREYVRSRLTWDGVAGRLRSLYQSLLSGESQRPRSR